MWLVVNRRSLRCGGRAEYKNDMGAREVPAASKHAQDDVTVASLNLKTGLGKRLSLAGHGYRGTVSKPP